MSSSHVPADSVYYGVPGATGYPMQVYQQPQRKRRLPVRFEGEYVLFEDDDLDNLNPQLAYEVWKRNDLYGYRQDGTLEVPWKFGATSILWPADRKFLVGCAHRRLDLIEEALAEGADPNVETSTKVDGLLMAARRGRVVPANTWTKESELPENAKGELFVKLVKTLLDAGFRAGRKARNGEASLVHLASCCKEPEVFRILLRHPSTWHDEYLDAVDPLMRRDAYDIAIQSNNSELMSLLDKAKKMVELRLQVRRPLLTMILSTSDGGYGSMVRKSPSESPAAAGEAPTVDP